MNSIDRQIKQILKEANSNLLLESSKSDAQEQNVIKALLDLGIDALPAGGYKPYDLSIGGVHYEVKEETGAGDNKRLAKLGSAKTGPVVKEGYISAVQILAKIMDDVVEELSSLGLERWIYDWWKTPAPVKKKNDKDENPNLSRAERLIRLEISQSLFSEITDKSAGNPQSFKPMLERLIQFLSFKPAEPTESAELAPPAEEKSLPKKITIGGEEIEVDDNLYRRILMAVKKSKFSDAENVKKAGGVSRLYNAVDDVLSQMPSDWNAYKNLLGKNAASEGGIAGIFGVRNFGTPPDTTKPLESETGEIYLYLPSGLEVVQMTQGARAVLKPTEGSGIKVFPDPQTAQLKSLFAAAIKAKEDERAKKDKQVPPDSTLESKIRDSIKEMLRG